MNKNKIFILIATVILCFAGFNNKYPLLTENSGAYINAGFTHQFPYSGSYIYGLFVKHSSWASSLWLTIFSQAAVIAILLYFAFKYIMKNESFVYYYVSFVFLSSFVLSGSLAVSTIDPGVFASVILISICLLLFTDKLRGRDLKITLFILFIGCITSIANLWAGTVIAIGCSILLPFYKRVGLFPRRLFLIVGVIISSWLSISLVNKVISGEFSIIPNYKVELLPRLTTAGFTKNYLDASGDKDSELYIYKDSLDVLFSSNSMYREPFLTEKQLKEYNKVSEGILAKPNFKSSFSIQLLKDFGQEMISVDSQNQLAVKDSVAVLKSLFKWYNEEVREVYLARQVGKYMDLKVKDQTQLVIMLFTILFLGWVLYKKQDRFVIYFLAGTLIISFVNAFIYGSSHHQWYFIWLWPMPVFFYWGEHNRIGRLKQLILNVIKVKK